MPLSLEASTVNYRYTGISFTATEGEFVLDTPVNYYTLSFNGNNIQQVYVDYQSNDLLTNDYAILGNVEHSLRGTFLTDQSINRWIIESGDATIGDVNSGNTTIKINSKTTIGTSSTSTYIITFNTNGGSNIETDTANSNDTISIPLSPTRNGYKFVEWQLKGEKYDFTKPITGDITLEAKWEESNEPTPTIEACEINTNYGFKNKFLISNDKNINKNTFSTKIEKDDKCELSITTKKNVELNENDKVGTGTKMYIYNGNSLVGSYINIIKGDNNGDGDIDISDLTRVHQHYRNKRIMSEDFYVEGSDMNNDGIIDISDLTLLYRKYRRN